MSITVIRLVLLLAVHRGFEAVLAAASAAVAAILDTKLSGR
jgi:hypothetical protein